MKRILSLILAALMLFAFSGCGDYDASSTASTVSDADHITITPSMPSTTDNIAANDPTNSEAHTLTDEGDEVDRTTNQMLDAAQFVSDSFALTLAVKENRFNTEIKTDALSMEYYCRAVQVQKAMNSDVELSKADFDKVVYDCFGFKPDAKIYQINGITAYANGSYTVSEFNMNMSWGLGFDTAEVLGNGYVRYSGDLMYSSDGSELNEKTYRAECLVKHTKESSYGFQLISFKIGR